MGRRRRIQRKSRRESKRQVEARRPRWLRHHFDVPSGRAPWTGIALSSTILTITVVKLIFAQLTIKEIKEKRGIKKKTEKEGGGKQLELDTCPSEPPVINLPLFEKIPSEDT